MTELQISNNAMRDSNFSAIIVETTATSFTIASVMSASIKAKTLRLDRIYLYKSNSEDEHLRWFREVEIRFLISPEYFIID